jgi:hypothetical protein
MLFNYASTEFLNWCIPGTYNTTKTLATLFDVDEFEGASSLAKRAMGDMLTGNANSSHSSVCLLV